MIDSSLPPEDRADFEQVLDEALLADAVRADPSVPAGELRSAALEASGPLVQTVADEYGAYRRLRDGGTGRAPAGGGVLAALAVLGPAVAAVAAVIILLLGYVLRVTGSQQELAGSLVATGWTVAAVAALLVAAGLARLILTVHRHRRPQPGTGAPSPETERAREVWRAALRDRALLPFLREQQRVAAGTAEDGPGPRSSGPHRQDG